MEEDQRKECCRKEENLIPSQERPDLIIKICRICHCRHFEVTLDPGKLGVTGIQVGG